MNQVRTLVAIVVMSFFAPSAISDDLLLTLYYDVGVGRSPATPSGVEVLFGYAAGIANNPTVQLGTGIYWDDSESGRMVMNQGIPGFETFAKGLSNGKDDTIFFVLNWEVGHRFAGSLHGLESLRNIGMPDLFGNEITSIEAVIHSVKIEPWLEGYSANLDTTIQIYGHAIPEPGTFMLLMVGGLIFIVLPCASCLSRQLRL